MRPLSPDTADRQYVVGETYRLAPREDVSVITRNHFHAAINDAWGNLPDHLADRHPSPTHLRKYALIKTGYCLKEDIVTATNDDALKVTNAVRSRDEYSLIQVQANVVTIWTAQSTSQKAMGKAAYATMKNRVLDYVSELIGVSTDELQKNARQVA